MHNYIKTFFNQNRAEAFAEYLNNQGAEDVVICRNRDAFGQTQFTVRWN